MRRLLPLLLAPGLLAWAACVTPPSSATAEASPGRPEASPAPDAAAAPVAVRPMPSAVAAEVAPRGPLRLVGRGARAMGTIVEIKVWTDDEAGAQAAIGEALDEIARLERAMTTWREDSDVSRVNAAAGGAAVEVSPETFEVVRRSVGFARASGGAFDISFYALGGLWKFDHDMERRIPDAKEIKRRLPLVDWRRIALDDKRLTVRLERAGMRINLGGIAKGYAVDRAAAILKARGFADSIVQAGGDLMMSGSKSGQPWHAGIRDPRSERDDYFAVADVIDHAFSTAGDYERYFVIDGKRYHHILDPRTGWPAQGARSVTVFAPDATTADGLDDAILILGPKKGLALLERYPGVGAVIVDGSNRVHVSKGLEKLVRILRPPTDGI